MCTAQDQILHGALSGQSCADAKCCVYVHSLYHQACAALHLSMCCLTLNITAAHSCTAASILSLLVLCPNWVGKLSYVDMPMRHASSNLCQIGI